MKHDDSAKTSQAKPYHRHTTGIVGEAYAAEFLRGNGYEVLHTNARLGRFGELDIVAKEKDILVFIEVKTRHSDLFGTPQESVNFRKQRKLCHCALLYMKMKNIRDKAFRFDVVAVMLNKDNTLKNIEVIKNAF